MFKDAMKAAGLALAGVVCVFMLGFLLNGMGLISLSFFAPKFEQVRYNTFKESQTYNDGMLRDLQNLRLEYLKANEEQQAALKAIVLHRFSVYPTDRMPAELLSFYQSINN